MRVHASAFAVAVVGLCSSVCPAATLVFVQGQDGYQAGASTFISYFKPDENLSQMATVRIRSTNARKALLRWGNLHERHPDGFIVQSAKLRVYVTTCRNPGGSDITVHPVWRPWHARDATWHTRTAADIWAAPGMRQGKDFDAEAMGRVRGPDAGAKGWIEIPLSPAAIQEWFSTPDENYGLVVKVVAKSQPGVDDQFYGNECGDVSRRPQLVVTGVPGDPPAPAIALARLVDADFRLPAYLNRDTATLAFQPARRLDKPITLRIHFADRGSGRSPAEDVSVTVEPGQKRTTMAVQIASWPDGEYLTTIHEARPDGRDTGKLVRLLRKQTITPPRPPGEPIDVAGLTMLFVDDWYIQARRGLRFKVHPAQTYPITKGMIADGRPMQRGLAFWLEPDGTFAAKLRDRNRRGEAPRYYKARSKDGKSWHIVEDKRAAGGQEPRVVLCAAKAKPRESYRFYEPKRDGPPRLDKIRVKYSDNDGARWGEIDVEPRRTFPVWQKSPGEFIILTRKPLTLDRPYYSEGHLDEWYHTNDNFAGQRLSKDGKTLHYYQGRAVVRFPPFRIGYDNLWAFNRILVNWSTRDGVNWTPTYFSMPTEDDPVGYQHYGAAIFPVESKSLWLAYLYAYQQAKQQICFELNYSRDSVYWHRFKREPAFAANGPPGSWNFGSMFPGGGRVVKGKTVYHLLGYCSNAPHFVHEFIYRGYDRRKITPEYLRRSLEGRGLKDWPHWRHFGSWDALCDFVHQASQTVGIMCYRENGWVSVRPQGDRGSLVTKALRAGSALSINARTGPGGSVRVEVLDRDGKPLGQYCGGNAAVFTGDSTNAELAWSKRAVKQLPSVPLRLRITIENADLFALKW